MTDKKHIYRLMAIKAALQLLEATKDKKEFIDTIDEAIKALENEKEIPKRVNIIHKVDNNGFHYNDPVCRCGYSFWFVGNSNYCPNCGQAIDWSYEEEEDASEWSEEE